MYGHLVFFARDQVWGGLDRILQKRTILCDFNRHLRTILQLNIVVIMYFFAFYCKSGFTMQACNVVHQAVAKNTGY